jgi:hypothetical protein
MRSEKWADILAVLILLLTVFCVVAIPVIGLGLALGYGLRAVIPGLDLGWAIVAGAVFATGIVDMAARLLLATREREPPSDEDDILADEPWIRIPRSFLLPEVPRKRRKKK